MFLHHFSSEMFGDMGFEPRLLKCFVAAVVIHSCKNVSAVKDSPVQRYRSLSVCTSRRAVTVKLHCAQPNQSADMDMRAICRDVQLGFF